MSQPTFDDILKRKLNQVEMELPEGDWDIIAKKMAAPNKKRRALVIWWAAAAMLVGVGIFVGVLHTPDSVNTKNLTAEVSKIEEKPSVQIVSETIQQPVVETQTVSTSSKKLACATKHKSSVKTAESNPVETVQPIAETAESVKVIEVGDTEKSVADEQPIAVTEEPKIAETEILSSPESEILVAEQPKKLTPEEAEKLMNEMEKSYQEEPLSSKSNNYTAWSLGLASSSALLNTVQGKTVAHTNPIGGGPIGVSRTQRNAHYDMPVTVGLSVGVALIPRLDILTGINYTYLSSKFSDITTEGDGSIEEKQQCHYLGIPLMLSYRFVDRKIVKCYTSIGGMGEKGLIRKNEVFTYAANGDLVEKTPSEYPIDGLQWSLTANVGVAVTLYKGLNIYFEPGFTWYIPNSTYPQPETMRTKNPYNLSLALGLRFNFDKKQK